jgi:GNAT superfamily N-acetyltransferase
MPETIPHKLKIEPLGSHHNRANFTCGAESLDRYFKTQASQDLRRKINGVFVLIDPNKPDKVLGYYTLCATSIDKGDVPIAMHKYIPRYPLVSATLIGRLAVLSHQQGQGLGALLLVDAVKRAFENASFIGSSMLIVDAISEQAAAFYEANSFIRLPDSLRLILPMHVIEKWLNP